MTASSPVQKRTISGRTGRLLAAYADQKLDARQSQKIRAWLQQSPEGRAFVAGIRQRPASPRRSGRPYQKACLVGVGAALLGAMVWLIGSVGAKSNDDRAPLAVENKVAVLPAPPVSPAPSEKIPVSSSQDSEQPPPAEKPRSVDRAIAIKISTAQPTQNRITPIDQPPANVKEPADVPKPPAPPPPPVKKRIDIVAGARLDAPTLARIIDQEVEDRLLAEKISASPRASDAEFLRRVYLDLHGVVPPVDKVVAFIDSNDPDKRAKLIDDLLAHPRFGQYMASIWIKLMLPNREPKSPPTEPMEAWLAKKFNANQPWDRFAHELLTAKGKLDANPAVRFFLNEGQTKAPDLTNTISSVFLGVQIKCAQCHNHPFTSWTSKDYWGMAGFFTNLTYRRKFEGLSDGSKVNTRLVDEDDRGRLIPPRFLEGTPANVQDNPREVFADWATAIDNPYFAKAIINRTWFHFLGRGFVNPIDDLHEDNKASHQALLDTLRTQFVEHDFDVKFLMRAICNSQTYQRASIPHGGNEKDEELFSRMSIKVMTGKQLFDSLVGILGEPRAKRDPRKTFEVLFTNPDPDPTSYGRGISELLRLMNSGEFEGGRKALVERVMQKARGPAKVVEELYLTVLARRPRVEENRRMLEFLNKHGAEAATYEQILWVLLNSSEFTLNH